MVGSGGGQKSFTPGTKGSGCSYGGHHQGSEVNEMRIESV